MNDCFNEELRKKLKVKGFEAAKKWSEKLKELQKQKDKKSR